jgi:hypothetical protein
MAETSMFKAIGLFILGIFFGLLIKYVPLPSQIQPIVDTQMPIVMMGLFIIAVVVLVKG